MQTCWRAANELGGMWDGRLWWNVCAATAASITHQGKDNEPKLLTSFFSCHLLQSNPLPGRDIPSAFSQSLCVCVCVCVWRRASCPSALDPRLGSVFVIPYEVHSRWGCFIHSGVLLVSAGTFRTYKLIRTRSTDGQRCALACGAWRLLLCPYCVWRFSDSSFTAKLYLISATSDEKTGRKSSWEEMTEWISEYLWISAFKPLTAEMAYQWWMSFTVDKARSININRTHTHTQLAELACGMAEGLVSFQSVPGNVINKRKLRARWSMN